MSLSKKSIRVFRVSFDLNSMFYDRLKLIFDKLIYIVQLAIFV